MALILFLLLILALGVPLAYSFSPASKARKRAQEASRTLETLAREFQELNEGLESAIAGEAASYSTEIRVKRLKAIPIEELKRHGSGIRLQALHGTGLHNLADLQGWSASRLECVRGVGPKSAGMISQIVASLVAQSDSAMIPHPESPFELAGERSLSQAIYRLRNFQSRSSRYSTWLRDACNDMTTRRDQILSDTTFQKWVEGFRAPGGLQTVVAESITLASELKGDHPTAKLYRELSETIAGAREESWILVAPQQLAEDYNANRELYVAHFTKHLGTSKAVSTPEVASTRKAQLSPTIPVPVKMTNALASASSSVQFSVSTQKKPLTIIEQSALPLMTDFWIAPDRNVQVQGFLIRGGMIYLDGPKTHPSGRRTDPSLIDPYKPIAKSIADCHVRHTNYWPSYDQITPEARASYLQWLASGRCDPQADVGYVFLYFYGLERRILGDMASDPSAKAELPFLEAELRRLIRIYSSNSSFRSYAGSLLDLTIARKADWAMSGLLTALPTRPQPKISLELKVVLGQHSRAGTELRADVAFAWYLSAPEIRRGQAVKACPDQFAELFKIEFAKTYPQGLKLPANKTRIKVTHRPASAILAGLDCAQELDLPDVTVLQSVALRLNEIGDTCNALLASYCRLRIGDPEGYDMLEASLRLPTCLWPTSHRQSLESLRSTIIEHRSCQVIVLEELLSLLPYSGQINRDRFKSIALRLSEAGLGIEPDLRLGGELPEVHERIALFDLADAAPTQAVSAAFASAALILQMTSTVATADNRFDDAEASVMLNQIQNELGLVIAEQNRLEARLALYRFTPPSNAGTKKRIETLDRSARNHVGNLLVQVALADGVIAPQEVKILENLFALMELDHSLLYAKLNSVKSKSSAGPPSDESSTEPHDRSSTTPKPTGMQLDLAKIALLRADTARVSALLGSVFQEELEEVSTSGTAPVTEMDSEPLLGLDAGLAALLKVLLERPQWSRFEVEELCSDRGLMTDGAIEQINDAAFQHFDCALLEGDDTIEVNVLLMAQSTSEEVV
jgi:tellurite resistance protein